MNVHQLERCNFVWLYYKLISRNISQVRMEWSILTEFFVIVLFTKKKYIFTEISMHKETLFLNSQNWFHVKRASESISLKLWVWVRYKIDVIWLYIVWVWTLHSRNTYLNCIHNSRCFLLHLCTQIKFHAIWLLPLIEFSYIQSK